MAFCDELLTNHRDQIAVVLGNPEHKHYAAVLKIVASYAAGLPTQRLEHVGPEGQNLRVTLDLGGPRGDA